MQIILIKYYSYINIYKYNNCIYINNNINVLHVTARVCTCNCNIHLLISSTCVIVISSMRQCSRQVVRSSKNNILLLVKYSLLLVSVAILQ